MGDVTPVLVKQVPAVDPGVGTRQLTFSVIGVEDVDVLDELNLKRLDINDLFVVYKRCILSMSPPSTEHIEQ